MARKCFMCGGDIADGAILCSKCDKPRKPKAAAPNAPAISSASIAPTQAGSHALDPFPKAPVLPFPVESATPAVTSVVSLLVAAGVASVLLGPDKSVKFVSDAAKSLFDPATTLQAIETRAGIKVGELSVPVSAGVRIHNVNMMYTLVPMSGGATGAVMIFRPSAEVTESQASFVNYVRETVFGPLRGLRDLLNSARSAKSDSLLSDAAGTVEQILSSLELAPGMVLPGEIARPVPTAPTPSTGPTVTAVVRRVSDRFAPVAELKGVRFQVDAQDLEERFADHERLADSLAILMENALQFVPAGGMVVMGVRWMEHKGKPLLLFFVMDNGPLVPEHLRLEIFERSFVFNPSNAERTGRGLFKTREFAMSHAGSVWVESKTGKACTFFLRVRPDGVR
ncbi:MAG: HAMP domain-containing histidine kinase [Thermoanaerobaculia bacterium]|nr:HAMP domain-containing histidine kinase [Thermoanaerobaculia bacterium]